MKFLLEKQGWVQPLLERVVSIVTQVMVRGICLQHLHVLVRWTITGNQFLNQGGPQLQNRALPGFLPEQIPAGATFSKFTPPAFSGLGFLQNVSECQFVSDGRSK